ncbi:unnamed protein product [Adineta ricciae]|uniref:B box-type domain-containing protein n=1 Tax=Adineta ricciae TaxID=249248 RepID=A0A816FJV1_ADIRI|nr:unnamed protein product [Adineta ricciae]
MLPNEAASAWKYQHKNSEDSPSSAISDLSPMKDLIDSSPFFECTTCSAQQRKVASKAVCYCQQCKSLQCATCEKEIHELIGSVEHQRVTVDEMFNGHCSVNTEHQATIHCPLCKLSFCHSCDETQHECFDGKVHKSQKYRNGQILPTRRSS